jgi:HK97 family phage prohead protease
MKTLTLICEAQLSLNVNEGKSQAGLIEARVTTWGARQGEDGRRFNYQPEGFAAWAEQFHASDKPVPMFLNHNDAGMPMGEWNEFSFDSEGMTATGRLFTNTSGGADLYHILKESPKLFGGVSIGAYAEEACFVNEEGDPMSLGDAQEGYFQITKGGISEVSVVMHPNNKDASIQKLEFKGGTTVRQIERILRDAGFSRKDAATASSSLKEMLVTRDADIAPVEESPNQREAEAVAQTEALLAALQMRELSEALDKRI